MYFKKILIAVVLLGLIVMGIFAWYVYSAVFVPNTAFNNEEAHVFIPTNATFDEVVTEVEPLLDDLESFVAVAKRKKYDLNIKSGHFIIKKGMNNNDIVNAIRSGNVPIKIKFNNQERVENLAGHLSRQLEIDSLSLLESMRDEAFLDEIGLDQANAITYFVPNTYEVYWNTGADDFRRRMFSEFNSFWNDGRLAKAEALGLTPNEVISLAAIVQKETAKTDERPRVAGVYVNRLKQGMPLQADPTVIYAKKLADNDFEQVIKRVLYRDLEIDSPYNTYKNAGLPPGPITMPDISSIDGVLNYEKHEYLYFVVDVTNFGYHKFAKSLAQHNRNKQEYVRWINSQGIDR